MRIEAAIRSVLQGGLQLQDAATLFLGEGLSDFKTRINTELPRRAPVPAYQVARRTEEKPDKTKPKEKILKDKVKVAKRFSGKRYSPYIRASRDESGRVRREVERSHREKREAAQSQNRLPTYKREKQISQPERLRQVTRRARLIRRRENAMRTHTAQGRHPEGPHVRDERLAKARGKLSSSQYERDRKASPSPSL